MWGGFISLEAIFFKIRYGTILVLWPEEFVLGCAIASHAVT